MRRHRRRIEDGRMNALTILSLVREELAAVGRSFDPAPARRTRLTVWCPQQPGFGTRGYVGRQKSYIVQARMGGRTRTVTIADTRLISEAMARDIARRVLVRVQIGENPAHTRLKVKEMPTYPAFLERYWQAVSPRWKPSTLERNLHYRKHLDRAFEHQHIDTITPGDVRTWFAYMTTEVGPAAANRTFELLRAMFKKAEEWGILLEGARPCHGVRLNKLRKHECRLSDEELARFGEALASEERKAAVAVAAIRLIALTGCRKSEICNLAWSEVRGRRLLLHDAKTGPRTVWLGEEARALLDKTLRDPGADRVFAEEGRGLSIKALSGCFMRVREVAGLGHVRLHDLRHSFASRAASISETLPMIAKLLGHADIKMTARYAHLDDASVLDACEQTGKILATLVGVDLSAWA
jgi:integrase